MGVTAEWVRLKEVKDSNSLWQKLSHILEMKGYTVVGVVKKMLSWKTEGAQSLSCDQKLSTQW